MKADDAAFTLAYEMKGFHFAKTSCLLSLRFTLFVKLYDPMEPSINTIIEQIKLSKLKQNHFFPFLGISYTSLKSPHFAFPILM